jgi:L-iditol 2-dehydrogenase
VKLARYHAGGKVVIEDAPIPNCPAGGLLVQVEASGLCSGELMTWYLDRKAPHVLGHEFAGRVIESQDARFPVGCRVAPHHHAPCGECETCRRGAFVHCPTWKPNRLDPGGMAEYVAVPPELLADTHRVDDLEPSDAALVEPLACVVKQLRRMRHEPGQPFSVVGLGVMGILHLLARPGAVGFDVHPARVAWSRAQGLDARPNGTDQKFPYVAVMPGSESAVQFALEIAAPDAVIGLFAPLPPGVAPRTPWEDYYFRDVTWVNSYSCGPDDTAHAVSLLRAGGIKASQVVSDFIGLEELPAKYEQMQRGEILKAMVLFGND